MSLMRGAERKGGGGDREGTCVSSQIFVVWFHKEPHNKSQTSHTHSSPLSLLSIALTFSQGAWGERGRKCVPSCVIPFVVPNDTKNKPNEIGTE